MASADRQLGKALVARGEGRTDGSDQGSPVRSFARPQEEAQRKDGESQEALPQHQRRVEAALLPSGPHRRAPRDGAKTAATTPAGTPGAFGGVEDPSPGSAGASLLGASFATGRANRRSAQAGFAGFGDAVRSEAEFLEILASLENAGCKIQTCVRLAHTATAPDMYINPDSDQPLKLRYDDVNGSVADPLAFYLTSLTRTSGRGGEGDLCSTLRALAEAVWQDR